MKKTTIILFFLLPVLSILVAKERNATLKLTDVTLMHEVRETPSPLDGARVPENPPALMFPDMYPHLGPVLDGVEGSENKPHVTYKIRLSRDRSFRKDVQEATIHWAFFNPGRLLEKGTWYWQYGYVKEDKIDWSPVLSFEITKDTKPFNAPALSELLKALPDYHPRVWLDKKEWDAIIARNKGNKEAAWYTERADRVVGKKLKHISEEIDTSGLAVLDNEVKRKSLLIRESRKIVDREEANIEALTRAYLLTKDKRYYRESLTRIEELLSWKSSPYFAGDFNASVLLSICTLGYDAFYDLLTPAEKKLLLDGIRENGNLFYEEFVNHLENRIADNHVWQMTLRILTMAAFASYGDLPEANTWIDYCYNIWVARLPGLNRDGGWHNGDSYFHVNLRTLIEVPYLYSRITGFDFFADPWYKGSADYVIYQQPPFSKSAGHGNGHEGQMLPNGTRVGYADALARLCHIGSVADYARYITQRDSTLLKKGFLSKPGDLTWFRLITDKTLPQGTGLKSLPMSKVFPETGLATFHSSLAQPEQNAMLSFRSSPYGSTSHALANQNGFNTFYGGSPIFYSSGHRTGFTDEHVMYAYRNTRAHNSILVDGMGQKIGTEGYGWIPRYYEGEELAYVVGDASNAYGEVTSPLWMQRARLSNIHFTPENGWDKNKVKTFRRHIVQLGRTGLMAIYDELEAVEPVQWSYLLHTTLYPMTMETLSQGVKVRGRNKIGVSEAYIYTQSPINATIEDIFFYPAENWMKKTEKNGKLIEYKNHWHFTGKTEPKQVCRFLTIIDTRDKNATPRLPQGKDGKYTVDGWQVEANLTDKGAPYLKITKVEDSSVSLILDDATIIQDKKNGKTQKVVLCDQIPDLEI